MSRTKYANGPTPLVTRPAAAEQSQESVTLGFYIWSRIQQCGVGRIFGVPGDFNLNLLDYIYDVQGLEWVGSTNELNAAYATDGYARTKAGAGCLVTTHGVGELSAINGVAGSMTEQVKVIHVVGQTSRQQQKDQQMIHHNIGPRPDHQVFNKAATNFRCASAVLWSEETAAQEVDRVLRECFVRSLPVYLYVPMDMVTVQIPSSFLRTPIDLSKPKSVPAVKAAASHIYEALSQAERPAIFVDGLVRQHDALRELHALLDSVRMPIFSAPIAKGTIDESHPCYIGIYNGIASQPGVQEIWNTCDYCLVLGDHPADTNTASYTRKVPRDRSAYVDPYETSVAGQIFQLAPMCDVIAALAKMTRAKHLPTSTIPRFEANQIHAPTKTQTITQSWIWHRIAEFMKPDDVVIGETGTTSFGLPMAQFPAQCQWITQAYYGSIGYATPAAFGADVALRELSSNGIRRRGRTLLATGDGSLMLTVQEVGNMIKQNAAPIIFIINNNGYTIERAIHGAQKSYNDIPPFDYSCMLQFLGMCPAQAKNSFHRAGTRQELEVVLNKSSVIRPECVQIVEIMVDQMDIPLSLAAQLAARGPETLREMKEAGFQVPINCQ